MLYSTSMCGCVSIVGIANCLVSLSFMINQRFFQFFSYSRHSSLMIFILRIHHKLKYIRFFVNDKYFCEYLTGCNTSNSIFVLFLNDEVESSIHFYSTPAILPFCTYQSSELKACFQ